MIPPDFATTLGVHPIVAEILWRRGYKSVESARAFLDPDCYTPVPPEDLPGMRAAVERLSAAIAQSEHIRVWGDFDADGQTSTSLLLLGLRSLGAIVDYTIPNRATHSHGLNKHGIAKAREAGTRVLLTCDCGVTDFDEIAYARELGMDVIISDHHDIGARLPDVCAVINPKLLPPDHPIANLPGVGVAYKLIEGLSPSPLHPLSSSPPLPFSPSSLLDLVALGIVADVAYQSGDTRYLLQRGMEQLRSHPRPGVRALLRLANIEPANLSAEAIGYQIGPRLNAVGRLDDPALSVELLTTADETRAKELAAKVETLNQERKVLQRSVEDEAFRQIAGDPGILRHAAIVLISPTWNASVLGVVASSISNRYARPAILISVRPGEVGRGSARSVPGVDIHAAITAQHDLIETSGGHPMAAGFAIRSENVPAFREGISRYVAAHAGAFVPADDRPEAVVSWRDVAMHLCDELERLAPFGPGNPHPLLMSTGLKPVRADALGSDGRHQVIIFQDDAGNNNRAIWWRSGGQPLPDLCDLVFTLQREVYRGKVRAQVTVVRIDPPGQTSAELSQASARFNIVDQRDDPDMAAALQHLLSEYGVENVQAWDDVGRVSMASCKRRLQLEPRPVLVILSPPPDPDVLAEALKRAAPQTVVLLTQPAVPEQDQPEVVMQQMAGMLKVSDQHGDSLQDGAIIARMAARIGQSEAIIRAGIDRYRAAKAHDDAAGSAAWNKIVVILREIHGYRHFFQEAKAEEVLSV
jgi:single-stranded-DNA-specific exonuclease